MSHDRFVFAPIHHVMAMVSHVRARPRLAAQTDLTRLSPKLPGRIWHPKLDRGRSNGGGQAGVTCRMGCRGLGLDGVRDGSANGSAFCSEVLCPASRRSPCALVTCAGGRQCRPRPSENIPGGQGVAGSNPAVPTGNRVFSNVLPLRKSQQKSQLVVQRPFRRRAPMGCHGVISGYLRSAAVPAKSAAPEPGG